MSHHLYQAAEGVGNKEIEKKMHKGTLYLKGEGQRLDPVAAARHLKLNLLCHSLCLRINPKACK